MAQSNDSYLVTPEIFNEKMNILIYGDPGAGKTHLAGTAQDSPYMADVHFFNVDGGLMTLASRGDIRATDIRSTIQLENELHRIIAGDEKFDGVRTFVIDNITELQTIDLEDIVRDQLKERVKSNKTATIDDIYIDDYGKSGKRIARILRGFRDLDRHVIYVAHKKDKMRKGSTILESSKPSLTEKLCTSVTGYMDFVWYLYTADVPIVNEKNEETGTYLERFLLTQPLNQYIGKTRGNIFSEAIGDVVQAPNLAEIMEIYTSLQSEEE